MTDVVQVKEEPTSVVRETCIPDLPSNLIQDARNIDTLTLEQLSNEPDELRRFELLNLYLVQLSKTEYLGKDDVVKDANNLRKLVRSDNNQLQTKVSELLVQYLKLMNLNTKYDHKLGGIHDSMLLLKLYQVLHDDSCYYLLPNVKAGEMFNKFLCNLISTSSSEYVFESVVKLFQRTVENVLNKYKNESDKNLSTEDARLVIGVMKTLLTLTKAFGSPPSPKDLLCSISVSVVNATKAHLCRLYSYNLIAFLIRDVTDKETLDRLLDGLSSCEFNQVTALVKESSSLTNVCNWRFKYSPSLLPSNTVNSSSSVNLKSSVEGQKQSQENKKRTLSSVSCVTGGNSLSVQRNVSVNSKVDSKRQKSDDLNKEDQSVCNDKSDENSELPSNWYRELLSTFESNRGEGKNVVVDKNAWKWKNDSLLKTLNMLDRVKVLELESVSSQFVTLFENLFKYESAIPVVINSLNLFTVLLVKGNFDFLSASKSHLLADVLLEKFKESNKKVRDSCVQALTEVVKRCKLQVVSDSFKKALVNVSPTCRENVNNFLNGRLLTTSDPDFYERLKTLLSLLSDYLKQLTGEKVPKVKQALVSVLDVLEDFNLVYSNQSTLTSTSTGTSGSLYSNLTTSQTESSGKVNYEDVTNKESSVKRSLEVNTTDYGVTNTSSSVTNVETVSEFKLDSVEHLDLTSQEYLKVKEGVVQNERSGVDTDRTQYAQPQLSPKTTKDPTKSLLKTYRTSVFVDNLVGVVDSELLDKFRVIGAHEGEGGNLDEALYNLCLWMLDNTKVLRSVDFYLLRLINEFYSYFKNDHTLEMFFGTMLSHPLSDDAFSEFLELVKCNRDHRPLLLLLNKNNVNTNKLLNPLNNVYYGLTNVSRGSDGESVLCDLYREGQRESNNTNNTLAFLMEFLNLLVLNGSLKWSCNSSDSDSESFLVLTTVGWVKDSHKNKSGGSDLLNKLTNFLVYFVKIKSDSCSRPALNLLCSLNDKYKVAKNLDKSVLNLLKYSRPSKELLESYKLSSLKLEKYVSKDLFNCMYLSTSASSSTNLPVSSSTTNASTNNRKRSCVFWKVFLSKGDNKVNSMLVNNEIRYNLVSWLLYCLYEQKCDKTVIDTFDLIVNYLKSKSINFDERESFLVTQSFVSYSTFGKYQLKALSVFGRLVECLTYSMETVKVLSECLEDLESDQWTLVMGEALVALVTSLDSKEPELVSYLSNKVKTDTKLPKELKDKLRGWLGFFSCDDKFSPSVTSDVLLQSQVSQDNHLESTSLSRDGLISKYGLDYNNKSQSSGLADSNVRVEMNVPVTRNVNVMETLETVHQDHQNTLDPVSTTDSFYEDCNQNKSKGHDQSTQQKSNLGASHKVDRVDQGVQCNQEFGSGTKVNETSFEGSSVSFVRQNEEGTKSVSSNENQPQKISNKQSSETKTTQTMERIVESVEKSVQVSVEYETKNDKMELDTLDHVVQEPVNTYTTCPEVKNDFVNEGGKSYSNEFREETTQEVQNFVTEDFRGPKNKQVECVSDSFKEDNETNNVEEVGPVEKLKSKEVVKDMENDQVILDEDVNVDLESCRRLSQQILDTPSNHVTTTNKILESSKDIENFEDLNQSQKLDDLSQNKNNESTEDLSVDEVVVSNRTEKDTPKVQNYCSKNVEMTTSYGKESASLQNDPETTTSFASRYGDGSSVVGEFDDKNVNLKRKLYEDQSAYSSGSYSSNKQVYGTRNDENYENYIDLNSSNADFSDGSVNRSRIEERYEETYDQRSHENTLDTPQNLKVRQTKKKRFNKQNKHSSGQDNYSSVLAEVDSDSESREYNGLNLVEAVLSQCSKVNNACLVSSYREYQKLAGTLCTGDFVKICSECCKELLNYKELLKGSLLRLLSPPLVEMCHGAVLLLTKQIFKSVENNEPWKQLLETLSLVVQVFKIATKNLQNEFALQFCNVVTNLLALPKELFQNEGIYCLVSSLVADNGLKQPTNTMYKLLMVMVELSMESLEGEVDRLLMAKLRFTKILQMQILVTLKNGVSDDNQNCQELKEKHVDFIRKLETFANRRSTHNVEKVIQTSNYLISTI